MFLKEMSFSFLWDNLEAIVEWLEALPDKGTIFAMIDTSMLKEAALEVFQNAFSEMPLTKGALDYSGFGTSFYGITVMFFPIGHPVEDPLHPPITRIIKLHPDSIQTIGHLHVLFAATLRERVGNLTRFDFDEVWRKHHA
jgi:hypothetical protein